MLRLLMGEFVAVSAGAGLSSRRIRLKEPQIPEKHHPEIPGNSMRLSQYFMPILRDDPKEAEIVSHKLMLRTGMIRQEAAGSYSWLPMGFRVLKKIEQIVREEQNRARKRCSSKPSLNRRFREHSGPSPLPIALRFRGCWQKRWRVMRQRESAANGRCIA